MPLTSAFALWTLAAAAFPSTATGKELASSPAVAPEAQCAVSPTPGSARAPLACVAAHYPAGGFVFPAHTEADAMRAPTGFRGCTTMEVAAAGVASQDTSGLGSSDDTSFKGLVVERGGCSFADKAVVAQDLGYAALVILDTMDGPTAPPDITAAAGIHIPVVMVGLAEGGVMREGEPSSPPHTPLRIFIDARGATSSALSVATAVPRSLPLTTVEPLVRAVVDVDPWAAIDVYVFREPQDAAWLVHAGAGVRLHLMRDVDLPVSAREPVSGEESVGEDGSVSARESVSGRESVGARGSVSEDGSAREPVSEDGSVSRDGSVGEHEPGGEQHQPTGTHQSTGASACVLEGALHNECVFALMRSNAALADGPVLWLHPSFDPKLVREAVGAFQGSTLTAEDRCCLSLT